MRRPRPPWPLSRGPQGSATHAATAGTFAFATWVPISPSGRSSPSSSTSSTPLHRTGLGNGRAASHPAGAGISDTHGVSESSPEGHKKERLTRSELDGDDLHQVTGELARRRRRLAGLPDRRGRGGWVRRATDAVPKRRSVPGTVRPWLGAGLTRSWCCPWNARRRSRCVSSPVAGFSAGSAGRERPGAPRRFPRVPDAPSPLPCRATQCWRYQRRAGTGTHR